MKDVLLTKEGYKKLQEEIQYLSNDRRREVAERIKVAREFGDISENAEYDDAKNEQAMLEARIAKLSEQLAAARVIEKREIAKDVVSVGAHVRLRDVEAKQTVEYHIVGSAEANPAELKLSNESPVGKAIIGKKKGETVEVVDAPRREAQIQDPGNQGSLTEVEPLPPGAVRAAAGVMARAFQDDPAWAWVVPDEERRRRVLPTLFRSGLKLESLRGNIIRSKDGAGVAIWMPPHSPRPTRAQLLRSGIPFSSLKLRREERPRLLRYLRANFDLRSWRSQSRAGC